MKLKIYTIAVAAIAFAACSEESAEADNQVVNGPGAVQTSNQAKPLEPAAQLGNPSNAQATSTAQPNPAHGQPGHRCDIGVGIPLDAPAGTGLQQNPAPANGGDFTINTGDASVQQVTPPAGGAPAGATGGSLKVNPPHGQPGHVCGVDVGAPLPAQQ